MWSKISRRGCKRLSRYWSHLEGVNCESLNIKNPVQSALLAWAVMKASHNARKCCETHHNCGASVLYSSTSPSVAILRCSAHKVGEKLSPAQVLHAQNTLMETANSLNISVAGGTALSTILAAAKVGKEEASLTKQPNCFVLIRRKGRCVASGVKAWHGSAEQVLDYLYSNPTSKD